MAYCAGRSLLTVARTVRELATSSSPRDLASNDEQPSLTFHTLIGSANRQSAVVTRAELNHAAKP